LKDEFRPFQEKLYMAITARETLVIPAVVFAELIPQFKGNTKQASLFLKQHKIGIEPLDLKAVSIAGQRWMKYLKKKSKATCSNCGKRLNKREHFLSDFYIGGFALAECDAILTRDRGIYKKYFQDLPGYEPLSGNV
ncbi:MAG: type II toxin-antitoxin system VapC family toxin, partial [Thermodesulfobacteriota bacterium]|nr:type II toxin-antitoxin system VapC family toxin [Thermodesulfobacteriota bacterium]